MAELVDKAILDDSDYLKSLGRMTKGIDGFYRAADGRLRDVQGRFTATGRAGEGAFGGLGKVAGDSGIKIGLVSGVVSGLTTELINLGKRAAQVFADIAADSLRLAASFEASKGLIKNIFQGDEEAANAVIDRLVKRGAEIGLLPETATKLGVSFLPDVGSIKQLDQFIEGAVKLRKFAPEKTFEDIRFSLEQLISGDVRAFQDRLNLPKEAITRGRELQKEYGNVGGALKLLDELFTKFGIDLEDISNTAIGKVGEIQSKLQEFQLVGGEQALEAIKPILDEIITFLTENREALILFASSLGDSAGSVAEFIAQLSGLENITPDQIVELGQSIFAFVEGTQAAGTLIGQLLSIIGQLFIQLGELVTIFNPITVALELFGIETSEAAGSVSDFIGSFFKGEGFFEKFLDFIAQAVAGLTLISVTLQETGRSAIVLTDALAALASGDIARAIELNAESQEIFNNSLAKGKEAMREAYGDSRKIIDEFTSSVDEQKQSQDELAGSFDKTNEAGLAQADAFLRQQQAAKDLNAALEGLAELEAEVAEKTAKAVEKNQQAIEDATTDHERKIVDIATEAARKRFDAAQDFANKRVDLARDNLQKIADLEQDYERDIEKSGRDLSRDIEDAQRDAGRAQIEQAKDEAQQQLDIETEHRRRIFDLRKKFDEDLGEYERTRDAVGFLRTVRQREQEISQAQTDRQRSIEDTRREGEQKRLEIQAQLEQQLEDARIADARRREDALIALEQGLEDQRENYARQQEELTLAEERKAEEIRLWQERQIEDANLAFERKLADLQLALEREIAAIKAAEEAKRAEFQATVDAAKAAAAEIAAAMQEVADSEARSTLRTNTGGRGGRRGPGAGRENDSPEFRSSGSIGTRPSSGNRRYPGFAQGGSFIVGGSGGTDSQIIPIRVTPGERVDITPAGQSLINQKNALVPPNPMLMSNMAPRSTVSNISNSRSQNINFPVNDASVFDDPIFAAKVRNIIRGELSELL